MLLNKYAQPIDASKIRSGIGKTLRDAPILLTDSDAFSYMRASATWSGCLYGSSGILKEIELKHQLQLGDKDAYALPVNEPVSLRLPDARETLITMIPISKTSDSSRVAYVIQDNSNTSLYVKSYLDLSLNTMFSNVVLRTLLCTEIDELYIDNRTSEQNLGCTTSRSNVFLWQSLTYMVRPKCVYGMKNEMPECVKAQCRPSNWLNSEVEPDNDKNQIS